MRSPWEEDKQTLLGVPSSSVKKSSETGGQGWLPHFHHSQVVLVIMNTQLTQVLSYSSELQASFLHLYFLNFVLHI